MKNTMRMVCIAALLLSVLLLRSAPVAYAQAGLDTQTLPGGLSDLDEYLATVDEGDSDKIAALTSLIVMYSEQLEEYDRSNGVFVVTCISFCGVVLGLAITIIVNNKEIKRPSFALSAVFALLPAVMTLCLYVFSMQCRRVVFFRGYLSYLEEKLSDLIGIPMVFNADVVPEFFGKFDTNRFGPIVMIAFIILLFSVSIWLCAYFAASPKNAGGKSRAGLAAKGILIIVFLLCVCFCGICAKDLATNGGVPNEVYQYCINIVK